MGIGRDFWKSDGEATSCSRKPGMTAFGVRREKAALFQWVQGPPGNRSSRKQPGQSWIMEVTKWLKPSISFRRALCLVAQRSCAPT